MWAGLGPAKLPADVLEVGHGRTDHRGCPVQGAAAHDAGDGTPADLAAVAALGKTQAPPPKTATFQKAPPPLFVPPAQQEEAKPPPPLRRRRPAIPAGLLGSQGADWSAYVGPSGRTRSPTPTLPPMTQRSL